jgi:transposase
VFGAIKKITDGCFAFPRYRIHHFGPRLTQAEVLSTMSVNRVEKTCQVNYREEELRDLWVGVHQCAVTEQGK